MSASLSSQVFASKAGMILRTIKPPTYPSKPEGGAWAAFLQSQAADASILGCISQPAHAALAGRLAVVLNGRLFDTAPEHIIGSIGSHDAGWSEVDIAALEEAEYSQPVSFVSIPPAIAVRAWRRSIAEAESKSPLSAYVVRSHFCLLAPRDNDIEHELFRKEQQAELHLARADLSRDVQDLDRLVAFLGFCDLFSLHLCSGWPVEFELPLAHPAHPSSRNARGIPISVKDGMIHLRGIDLRDGAGVYVNGWERTQSGSLLNRRYEWTFR